MALPIKSLQINNSFFMLSIFLRRLGNIGGKLEGFPLFDPSEASLKSRNEYDKKPDRRQIYPMFEDHIKNRYKALGRRKSDIKPCYAERYQRPPFSQVEQKSSNHHKKMSCK